MERKFLNIGLSLALGAILLLGGCARKTGDRTQIHFTAPPLTYAGKAGAQAASLNVVFVNGTVASNPNVKPLRYQWDSHSCQPGAACSPAASLSWEVPNGSTPLIQILAVYEDESNGHMKFMYADQEKAVSGAIANVNLKRVEAGDSNLQGHIYGRYLDGSAMGGPTGAMIGKFHPPGGRAPMELFNDPMIAGWFSAMVMEAGANFSYTVNGRAIFPEINISSALLGTSAHMLRVAVPAYKRDNGGGALELEGAQKLFLGYFGSVPAGKKACYDSSSNPIADTAQASGSLAPIVWQSPPAAGQAGVEAGGEGISVAGSGHTCHNDANAFKDFLFFHQAELRNGRDSVSGMRPPFRSFDVGGYRTYASTTHDAGANTLTIDYKLLPDASGAVNGMTVFMRARPPNDHDIYGMGEGIACTTVNSKYQSMGFAFGGDFPIVHPASDGQAVVGNIISPVNTQFVLCPYSNASGAKTYFDAGIEAYSFGAMGPINQLSLRLAGTQPMQSNARGPSLPSAGVRLLKSAVMNGYHAILVKAGEMYVESTFLEKAEVSVDGGVNWTQVAVQGNSYMGFTGPIAALPITSSGGQDALFNVLDAAPNSVIFKIRVKLTPAGKTRYGVASDTVIGPAIQLAAADICSSATLQLVDESDVLISPSSLFSPFTGTGGTDLERTFSLAWNGCSLPTYAPIDYIGFSSVDNSCFDQSDIQPVASNPMQFKISPTDKYGADCYIGGSISFVQPSSGGTPNKVEVFTSSVELRHSSAPAKVKVLALAVDPFTSIT
ncbi:MAG TPA: hypothetical protein PKC28_13020, partial [Bdellovibrionales bacterium]|nr:hypothetical protein [Bdellovibrionales bacterium]